MPWFRLGYWYATLAIIVLIVPIVRSELLASGWRGVHHIGEHPILQRNSRVNSPVKLLARSVVTLFGMPVNWNKDNVASQSSYVTEQHAEILMSYPKRQLHNYMQSYAEKSAQDSRHKMWKYRFRWHNTAFSRNTVTKCHTRSLLTHLTLATKLDDVIN